MFSYAIAAAILPCIRLLVDRFTVVDTAFKVLKDLRNLPAFHQAWRCFHEATHRRDSWRIAIGVVWHFVPYRTAASFAIKQKTTIFNHDRRKAIWSWYVNMGMGIMANVWFIFEERNPKINNFDLYGEIPRKQTKHKKNNLSGWPTAFEHTSLK